ncbi:hypothetical protein EMIT07CA2_20286 [Brevibacillus sp. IT-7CA2]
MNLTLDATPEKGWVPQRNVVGTKDHWAFLRYMFTPDHLPTIDKRKNYAKKTSE